MLGEVIICVRRSGGVSLSGLLSGPLRFAFPFSLMAM
jgi:hypothetical protein